MPIARPIAQRLAGEPLETVVDAIAVIAATLARLVAEHRLGHRDIKPGNLYELDGRWLVGDFGLIAAPDLEELARTGRPFGPAHYTAYELMTAPATADPHPADAYSLGKTLWVLATEQAFPPEGFQPANSRGFRIQDLRPHRDAPLLDRLIDACTRLSPSDRPTLAVMAEDLDAWQRLARDDTAPFDIADLGAQLRTRLRAELDHRDVQAWNKECWLTAVREHQRLMTPINRALVDAHPATVVDATDDRYTLNVTKTFSRRAQIAQRWQRCTKVPTGDRDQYVLRVGRGIEVDDAGQLIIHAFVDVGDPTTSHTDFLWNAETRYAPAGSVRANEMLAEQAKEIADKVKEALGILIENLPAAT